MWDTLPHIVTAILFGLVLFLIFLGSFFVSGLKSDFSRWVPIIALVAIIIALFAGFLQQAMGYEHSSRVYRERILQKRQKPSLRLL